MDSDVRQKEISRDLDSYISSKRKGSGLFGMFSKREDEVVSTHPGVKPYDDAPAAETVVEAAPPESAPVEAQEMTNEDAPVAEKKGWFSKFFSSDDPEQGQETMVSAPPADDADLREVARISLAFMRMTDPAALAQIKASQDFEKFKEILRRRNIIK
jgi:hypothetical protein